MGCLMNKKRFLLSKTSLAIEIEVQIMLYYYAECGKTHRQMIEIILVLCHSTSKIFQFIAESKSIPC